MNIVCENEKVKDELVYIIKLFYPNSWEELDYSFNISQEVNDNIIITKVSSDLTDIEFTRE